MEKDYRRAIKDTARIVDMWLPMKIRYDKIPGASVGIVYKGRLVYKRGFGHADLERKKKATPQTLYRIASISKTFTTVAIMQLVERGKLRLDDPLSKYISWFKGVSRKGDLKNVTVRHILSHSAGLFRDGVTPHWETGEFPKSLKAPTTQAIVYETLERFKYSNYAFSLLGEVIEKASGTPYEKYIEENVLRKLGMASTYPDLPDHQEARLATGYSREIPNAPQRPYEQYQTNAFAPATGFTSNVVDLAKFLHALSLEEKRSKLLSREAKKEIMRPHEKTGGEDEYGLGLDIYNVSGRKTVGHSGGFRGFSLHAEFDPKEDLGVIVLTNSEAGGASRIADGILRLIHHLFDERNDYYKGKVVNDARYEGLYRNRFGDSIVVPVGSKLVAFSVDASTPTRGLMRLTPTSKKDTFEISMEGKFGDDGEIARFTDFKNGKAHKVFMGPTPATRYAD